jgi:nitroreductase
VSVVPSMQPAELAAVDRLLTTTRSIRRRLDLERPVDDRTVQECLDLAVHAPSAEDRQNWRWLVVTDPALRAEIARRYHHSWTIRTGGGGRIRRGRASSDKANVSSVTWLAQHLHEVPVLVIPCVLGRPPVSGNVRDAAIAGLLDHLADVTYYGSIMPAVWSFQLALRSRGLGSVITCMHLPFEAEVATLLGIPRSVTQVCLLPVAHITGIDLGTAPRSPAPTGWNGWSDEL